MEDLIVIILTLLVAVFGIIGQSRKRKQNGQQPQAENSSGNFWDMLESQFQPEQQFTDEEPWEKQEMEEAVTNDIVDVVPPKQTYKFEAKNEGKSFIKEKTLSEIIETETQKKKREKFPLRKAVIYSEILNRKYT